MSKPKIIYGEKSEVKEVKFSDIKIGQTFIYQNSLYMRIGYVEKKHDNELTRPNAIALPDSKLEFFMDYDDVETVEIKVLR